MPYYVRAATEPGQGVGWFWIPPGGHEEQLLGANVYMAQLFLLRQLDEET